VSSFVQFLYTWQHLNESSATVHWTEAIPIVLNLHFLHVCELGKVDDKLFHLSQMINLLGNYEFNNYSNIICHA
jgi:hypothetical protein